MPNKYLVKLALDTRTQKRIYDHRQEIFDSVERMDKLRLQLNQYNEQQDKNHKLRLAPAKPRHKQERKESEDGTGIRSRTLAEQRRRNQGNGRRFARHQILKKPGTLEKVKRAQKRSKQNRRSYYDAS